MADSENTGVLPPTDIANPPNIARSVTEGDSLDYANPMSGMLGLSSIYAFIAKTYSEKLLPALPGYWSRERDLVLSKTPFREGLWASVLGIAITQATSSSFDIDTDSKLTSKRIHQVFADADGGEGFESFLEQHLMDYFTTDNGAFIEIIRVKDDPGARIIGFGHLDSLRCWRTGNPVTPVFYQDLQNKWHAMKWYQVAWITDMKNPRSNYFGVGLCAASRAYERIQRRAATQLYLNEKLNPTAPHTLAFPSGINEVQLAEAFKSHEINQKMKGMVVYGGVAFVPTLSKDGVRIEKMPLTELIPNFDPDVEFTHDVILYTDAVGMDSQNVKPLTGGNMGTGAQSEVLDNKEKGKGLVGWKKKWAKFVNKYITSNNATYFWMENDLRDKLQKAQLDGQLITNATSAVAGVGLPPQQGIQYLVDEDVFPQEFLPGGIDTTAGVTISDTEKPYFLDDVVINTNTAAPTALPDNGQPVTAAAPVGTETTDAPQGEPGVSNVTVLEDDEPEDEELAKASTDAPKTGPGSRGGKYWIDAQGKVHYGEKPGYARDSGERTNLAPKQIRALNRRAAKFDLTDSTTGKPTRDLLVMQSKGWQPATGPGGGYDFGKGSAGKNAAIGEAETLAAANPDRMYVVTLLEPGKNYAIISKPVNDLPKPPAPKKPDKSNAPVAANVGGAARSKPKEQKKEILELADYAKELIGAAFGN